MPLAGNSNDCKPCFNDVSSLERKSRAAFIPGFLLIVLPKCPFCFMAFSSTLLLCGEGATMVSERIHHSGLMITISIIFCLASIAGILLVRRDIRTFYALILALAGSAMILASVVWGGGMALYFTGTIVLFFGVWLNSSLLYILNKMGFSPDIHKWPGSNLFSFQTKYK